MAVDIKKVLTSLKERKETTLVWGLGAVALCLGVFLFIGFMRGVSPPASLEAIIKRTKSPESREEIAEKVVAKLKETQKIPPFIDYQDILTRSLFIKSRVGIGIGEPGEGTGVFELKGLIEIPDKVKAFINDPAGKPHLVGKGQMIGTTGVKVGAIDFKNQSATLIHKDWTKPRVIRMAREEIEKAGDMITFKPSEKKKAAEKPKGVTEEEAKKAIAEAKKALSDASDVILTARSEGGDTDEAEDRRDDAKVKLQDAQEAMKEKDYKRAKESAKSAQALAREAKRLAGEAEEEKEEEERREEERREDEEDEEEEEEPEGPGEEPAF